MECLSTYEHAQDNSNTNHSKLLMHCWYHLFTTLSAAAFHSTLSGSQRLVMFIFFSRTCTAWKSFWFALMACWHPVSIDWGGGEVWPNFIGSCKLPSKQNSKCNVIIEKETYLLIIMQSYNCGVILHLPCPLEWLLQQSLKVISLLT